MFKKYKRFEKAFFKEDKAQDMVTYIKLKHQFRSMLMLTAVTFVPSLYMLIEYQLVTASVYLILLAVLVGFRTKSYNALRILFLIILVLLPLRYLSESIVLVFPVAFLISNVQILVQTQSINLMVIHLIVEAAIFYFYGTDFIVSTIKEMSEEELTKSVRGMVLFAFMVAILNIVTMKLFYSQFSSLLRKVNKLTENISKVNNQLNDQNLKLQSNLEMKDVFIYTFSHELKNALNGLLGNLSLAYDTAKAPQVIQFLSSAKVCGEVLKNFIHNILDSGKLEKGNLEVSLERKDVMSFMQSVWAICGKIIENKRLKGSLEIEKNVPRFLDLDEQRIIQIILNLVSNAVKFTEKGYVRIRISWQTVSTYCDEQERKENLSLITNNSQNKVDEEKEEGRETARFGDMREFPDNLEARPSMKESYHLEAEYEKKFIESLQVLQLDLLKSHWNREDVLSSTLPEGSKGILKLQVLDSGCGMTPEDQNLLFQKFSQVSPAQDQRKVGTGLGLWICKELARRLDGDIKARSMVGVGSVFELKIQTRVSAIPKKPNQHQDNEINSLIRISSEQRSTSNMLKILVADDDSFNIELMKNYLNKFGINYIYAYDGEEAVSLFKKHYKEIGFVITDNFMPKKTGTEAAFEIADFLEEKQLPKIPIICISGDLKVHVTGKGITSVIQKPINFDRLKEELMVVYPQLAQFTSRS